ncbi:uncharacterized protein LOC114279294 [Camellia sinensis]|uniref:uncharacterized protein LOC114279294 n=1 Tax=Camellia sinensis TaxID=4442 RepID=UPI0010357552|nr:uncharacterized protein LOC114279294 [Camellia sinensis]
MMTNRLLEKDQIRMIVRNLHGKMLQKMIVLPLFTFNDLNEIGVQIEDAIKQGIIVEDKEPVRKPFGRSSNVTASGSIAMKPSEINMVATTTKIADPFAHAGPQNTTRAPSRTFTPLYMSLSIAMNILTKRGYLKPLDPRPLPEPLPAKHDPTKHCAFHQQPGHDTDRCVCLRHEIQDLIDNKVITPPQPPKPNVTTNPLPPHDRVPSPPHLNLIHTLSSTFNPSIYITPTHLPKPEVYIPEGTELCMMDAPPTQPKPKNLMVVVPMLEAGKLSEKKYDPSRYIIPRGKLKLKVDLADSFSINVVRDDVLEQGLNDLANLEEDLANLHFLISENLLNVVNERVAEEEKKNQKFNEIDHLTRSGRYFKPPHLDQGEPSGKDKEVKKEKDKGKEKEEEEDLVLKQLKKIQANISIWGLLMASREHRQAMLSILSQAKLSIDTTPEQLVSLITPREAIPAITFADKELPQEGSGHNKPLYVSLEC